MRPPPGAEGVEDRDGVLAAPHHDEGRLAAVAVVEGGVVGVGLVQVGQVVVDLVGGADAGRGDVGDPQGEGRPLPVDLLHSGHQRSQPLVEGRRVDRLVRQARARPADGEPGQAGRGGQCHVGLDLLGIGLGPQRRGHIGELVARVVVGDRAPVPAQGGRERQRVGGVGVVGSEPGVPVGGVPPQVVEGEHPMVGAGGGGRRRGRRGGLGRRGHRALGGAARRRGRSRGRAPRSARGEQAAEDGDQCEEESGASAR